jgi:chromosome segregation ATPase
MVKKVFAVTLGVVVACYVLSHTRVGSYVGTAWKQLRKDASEQVSFDFEIARIKSEVAKLDKDIDESRTLVAGQMVDVKEMRKEVEAVRKQISQKKESIAELVAELKTGSAMVSFGGDKISSKEGAARLREEIKASQLLEKRQEAKEQLLAAQERILASNREKLNSMGEKKSDYLVQVTKLEAEWKEFQASQLGNSQVDTSRYADIESSLKSLRTRLEVKKTKLELETEAEVRTQEKPKTIEASINEGELYLQGGGKTTVSTGK